MGKLRAGPVWDYNLAFGYDAFGNRSRYDVWQFNNGNNDGPKFWKDLFDTDLFRCYLAKRWFELTEPGQPLNYDFVCNRIDEIDALIAEAIPRDNQRWNQMTQHTQYVEDMKNWIQLRINWLNQNIGSSQGCTDVDLPPLVISKIHYHPMDYWGIDGDHYEFIEITNNGSETVDLTGVYFRELGITYRFPNGSHVAPHEAILLCSDSLAFVDYYRMVPFGQYTRKLSNKSENLVLADAWGNVIDEVHYYDTEPWPVQADGDGPYLELKNLDSDNSLAENWTIGNDLTGIKDLSEEPLIRLYPNPTDGEVHIIGMEVSKVQVYNTIGQMVKTFGEGNDISLSGMPKGLYFLLVTDNSGNTAMTKSIVK